MTPQQPYIEIKKEITGGDFSNAGGISSELKNILQQAGLPPQFIRRVVIATYEAEMNVVIHAYRGTFFALIYPDHVQVVLEDEGPGIPDVDLAFQEGFSTAPPHIREMGFGAGYGLSNMKKCSNQIEVITQVGKGTKVKMTFWLDSSKTS
ncbi:MAG: anti-sigma regulatory factor [Candidatus Atribacteria bacterium]|nr:anti-sigma regulatory factor [Candidatus Atribacteria bacterium]